MANDEVNEFIENDIVELLTGWRNDRRKILTGLQDFFFFFSFPRVYDDGGSTEVH